MRTVFNLITYKMTSPRHFRVLGVASYLAEKDDLNVEEVLLMSKEEEGEEESFSAKREQQ